MSRVKVIKFDMSQIRDTKLAHDNIEDFLLLCSNRYHAATMATVPEYFRVYLRNCMTAFRAKVWDFGLHKLYQIRYQ